MPPANRALMRIQYMVRITSVARTTTSSLRIGRHTSSASPHQGDTATPRGEQRATAEALSPLILLVIMAVLSSVDWIAWLSLRDTDAGVRAAILSALTSLVLSLGRACVRLLTTRPGAGTDYADKSLESEQDR